jgi:hypothetical protein
MSASTPPPPTNGNGKYLLLGIIFLLGIVGLVVWKAKNSSDDKVVNTPPPPSAAPSTSFNQAQVDDIPPPPPPEPDAGPAKKVGTNANQGNPNCDRHCSGSVGNDLETALAFRAKQAHRCYDQALANDSTLQGKVTINVRIAPNGAVCSANVGSSDLASPSVAQCVAGYFRTTSHFPSPKGGCVDTAVPISFVPGGR